MKLKVYLKEKSFTFKLFSVSVKEMYECVNDGCYLLTDCPPYSVLVSLFCNSEIFQTESLSSFKDACLYSATKVNMTKICENRIGLYRRRNQQKRQSSFSRNHVMQSAMITFPLDRVRFYSEKEECQGCRSSKLTYTEITEIID